MKNKGPKLRVKFIFLILVLAAILIWQSNSHKIIGIFYPFPYEELVFTASERFAVDPYLILAVMKAESKFQEEAVSTKGARGLMQIMPETGLWIADQLKVEKFHPDQLFEPETNIMFGTWYLAFLAKEFNGRLAVILASYNAGPGKVKDWLAKNIWDGTDNSIRDIPFAETRKYIQKVAGNYRYYTIIYNRN